MSNILFSTSTIHTFGGASLAVLLIVQFIKEWPGIRRIPTKGLAVIIGEILFLLTTVPGPFPSSVNEWVVLLLNGLLTASAAIGGWHLTTPKQ